MHCSSCNIAKLSQEFPDKTLTADCKHAALHCFRCVIKSVTKEGRCSQCQTKVSMDNENYQRFVKLFEYKFPHPLLKTNVDVVTPAEKGSKTNSTIRVIMLNGDFTSLAFNPNMTIKTVKEHISKELKVSVNRQRLLLNGKELKDVKDEVSRPAALRDHGVKPFDSLQLIALLYDLTSDLDDVIFDLFWGYPDSGIDCLDASALIFSEDCLSLVVDYRHRDVRSWIRHSGDIVDNKELLGHQTINVSISKIPSGVTKIFFTLSAWKSPNISKFKNPSLKFYDVKRPNQQLCSDTMYHAGDSQAIIMCALCRVGENFWKVYSLGEVSSGNAKNYDPLKRTIMNKIVRPGLV